MRQKYVYHASPKQNLKKIVPKKSTHNKSWVYAAKDKVMASLFLGKNGGDFTCNIAKDHKKPCLCERFKGAIDLRYNKKASLYVLPAKNFLENKTSWKEEVVCSRPVKPIKEIKINNAKEYLIALKKKRKLLIKYYPKKFSWIPKDDSDLIGLAVEFGKNKEEIKKMLKHHPKLVKRALETPKQLYHGSYKKIKGALAPRKATGLGDKKGKLMGVYATHIKEAAIVMAMISGKNDSSLIDETTDPRGIIYNGAPNKNIWLYTLPVKGFKKLDSWQWITRKEVKPKKIEKIKTKKYTKRVRMATDRERKAWYRKYGGDLNRKV